MPVEISATERARAFVATKILIVGFGCLTDDVLLRWIKQNRAVDTSEASASARSVSPPTAATFVRRHSKMHSKGQLVKGAGGLVPP